MGTGSSVKRIVLSTIFITAEFPLSLFHSVFYLFFFWRSHSASGILVSRPGMEPCALQWKLGVLTTGHQGSPYCSFLNKLPIPQAALRQPMRRLDCTPPADPAPALTACRDEDVHRVTEGPHAPFGDGSDPHGARGVVHLDRKLSKAAVLANFFRELFLGGRQERKEVKY